MPLQAVPRQRQATRGKTTTQGNDHLSGLFVTVAYTIDDSLWSTSIGQNSLRDAPQE